MSDLSPDKARQLGLLMLELHAEFRKGHGLPPMPSSLTLHDHLRTVTSRASLVERDLLRSPKPIIGTVLRIARRIVSTLLNPIFYRQTDVNRDLLLALEAVTRDSAARRRAHEVLSARVAELETVVARLDPPRE